MAQAETRESLSRMLVVTVFLICLADAQRRWQQVRQRQAGQGRQGTAALEFRVWGLGFGVLGF
jgi:hypothetical protein